MDIQNTLFGALSPQHCNFFFLLSILGFIWLFFYSITALYLGVVGKKKMEFWLMSISISLGYFIFYYQNRLLYTMCQSSLGK
jgi:hypothetical protein